MNPAPQRIDLDTANHLLGTFGISQPSKAYKRWEKPYGFDLKDFDAVLFESPFIFVIDWRAWLQEELETVVKALAQLDVKLDLQFDEEGNSGTANCGSKSSSVTYEPNDDNADLTKVFRSIQSVMPSQIEFRSSPSNKGSDTLVFGVLTRQEWADLEKTAPNIVKHYFCPL